MRRHPLIGFLSILILIPAHALPPPPEEIKLVPVNRLFTNLQNRLAVETNNLALTYQLARLHSLAYATNLISVAVRKQDEMPIYGKRNSDLRMPQAVQMFMTPADRSEALKHLTNAIALYERALNLLKKSADPTEAEWIVVPTQLGFAWCLQQSGQRDQALVAYRKALGAAWHWEVAKDFNFQKWVSGAWDATGTGSNSLPERGRGPLGPGVCYTQEIIDSLLRLLDSRKDAVEISRLTTMQGIAERMPRAYSPILVPLKPGLSFGELINPLAGVAFDLDGSGLPRRWGWITQNAAWLVFDPVGRGQITSGLQLFGNVTFWIFWRDGYAALASLDDNGDGVLCGSELRGLALWHDVNGNGISNPGEVLPVATFGISAISCDSQPFSGSATWNPRGVTFTDGTVRATYDWIAPSK